MNYKKLIKTILTYPICIRWSIKEHGKCCYIGIGSKIDCKAGKLVLGSNVNIMKYNLMHCFDGGEISIGDNTDIGQFSRITSANKISIGSGITTGPNIFISDYNHRYDIVGKPIKNQGIICNGNEVIIGDGTWIGTNCVIVGNIHIGKGCVIGANSLINKDIPEYCVAVGSPAKIIKRYDKSSKKWVRV